jgi:hypothetical protein
VSVMYVCMYVYRGSLKVAPMTEKMRSNSLAWYVIPREAIHLTKVMSMNIDGYPSRGQPKKR